MCEFADQCAGAECMDERAPYIVTLIRLSYCGDNRDTCARHRLYLVIDEEEVPDDLWPGDEARAAEIIGE